MKLPAIIKAEIQGKAIAFFVFIVWSSGLHYYSSAVLPDFDC